MCDLKFLILLPLLLLAACVAGPNDLVGTAAQGANYPAGFWLGLWHGMICAITFLLSLFNDNVSMYEVHNKGGSTTWDSR